MAHYSSSESPENAGRDRFRAQKKYADLFTREQNKLDRGYLTAAATRGTRSPLDNPDVMRMSGPDQVAAVRRSGQYTGANDGVSRNYNAEREAGNAVARSWVPTDINTANSRTAGAVAASPPPPAQSLKMTGNGKFVPKTGDELLPSQVSGMGVAKSLPAASAPRGTVVSQERSDALLGPVTGANGYGTGSVRTPKEGEVGPAVETETGIVHAPTFDQTAARLALKQKHPAIFEAGTPENEAFVAHAKQYGEASAHENADAMIGTLRMSQNNVRVAREAARPESPTNPDDTNTAAVNAALQKAPDPVSRGAALASSGIIPRRAVASVDRTLASQPPVTPVDARGVKTRMANSGMIPGGKPALPDPAPQLAPAPVTPTNPVATDPQKKRKDSRQPDWVEG